MSRLAIGGVIVDEMKAALGPAWESLTKEDREQAVATAFDFADLQLQALAGRDVERELAHVRAQQKGLSSTARDALEGAVERIAIRWAVIAGKILRGLALGAIAG